MHPHSVSLEARIAALLPVGRLLADIHGDLPTDVGVSGSRIENALAQFANGNVLEPSHSPVIEEMSNLVLGYFEERCPGHVETLFRGSIQDFPLHNPEWSVVRCFWDTLLRFRVERQQVFDEIRAAQIAASLWKGRLKW